jgi:hypothetical protein
MSPLTLAKRRWSRRRTEQGAALFVVSMTIAVLASVGIYALAAASNDVKTSGYERQNTQTHYLSSYGVLGTAHEIASSKAQFYMMLMLTTPDVCPGSLPGVPATTSILTRACRRLGGPELSTMGTTAWNIPYVNNYTGTVPFQSGVTPGSLGPNTIQGDFFVELTEPAQVKPPAGYGLGLNFCFVEMTATSNGITQPTFPLNPNWTQTFGGEGIEMQRARILAGPVACPR